MKKFSVFLLIFLFLFGTASFINADVLEYDAGAYSTPEGWGVIGSVEPYHDYLTHGRYYTWNFGDLTLTPIEEELFTELRIVFHGIENWQIEENTLDVYIFDDPLSLPEPLGWNDMWDGGEKFPYIPDWGVDGYNAAHLGTWSYIDEAKDVVFYTTDSSLLEYLINGDSFGIGIDPECYFTLDHISLETPVPEPATMLLLGSGMLGLGIFGRKKRKKG